MTETEERLLDIVEKIIPKYFYELNNEETRDAIANDISEAIRDKVSIKFHDVSSSEDIENNLLVYQYYNEEGEDKVLTIKTDDKWQQ